MDWAELEGSETYQTGSDSDRNKIRSGWEKDFSADYPEPLKPVVKQEPEDRTILGTAADVGLSVAQGAVDLGSGVVGLANLATGGNLSKPLEAIGYDPEFTNRFFQELKSDAQQQADTNVARAEGFGGKVKSLVENPSTIPMKIARTLPLMGGSGAIAKGLAMAAPKVMASTTGRIIGSGIGEGALQTGTAAEEIRGKTGDITGKQALTSFASGVTTGAITALSGGLAKKLGFTDVDSLLAGVSRKAGKKVTAKEVAKTILGGGFTEGVLEEMPQSAQETVWMNAALGKPLMEGVEEAAAEGLVLGAAMGGGINAATINRTDPKAGKTDQEIEITNRATNILAQGSDGIANSVQALTERIQANQVILEDQQKLEEQAAAANIEPTVLATQILEDNNRDQGILDKINSAQGVSALQEEQQATPDIDPAILAQMDESFHEAFQNELFSTIAGDQIALEEQDAVRTRNQQFKKLQVIAEDERVARNKEGFESRRRSTPEEMQRTFEEGGPSVQEQEALNDLQSQALEDTIKTSLNEIKQEADPEVRKKLYADLWLQHGIKSAQEAAEVFTKTQPSPFIDEQQLVEPNQVDDGAQVVTMEELEAQLTSNEQQLAALDAQIKTTTDPNELAALQQEASVLYEQNASLEDQWQKQYQAQNQNTLPESNAEFQTAENQETSTQVNLADIKKAFPEQSISQAEDGTISIQFKNGKGLTIKSIQDAGQGYVKLAIETGQMSKDGKILGITVGNEILLDANFADNKTLWHENKHVLDNLGMITKADNSALNAEFNKLRKANKLDFALSTHEDSKQRMIENRANMFAQIMVNREAYRNTPFGKTIQRIMDFFQQMFNMSQSEVIKLAREAESGKIYERQVNGQTVQTTVPQAETTAKQWYSTLENAVAGFQQKQATPDQWKGMIKNFPGIKQEELDWMGLNEWLAEQKGKVTQKDLLQFIQENNVQLEEVVKEEASSLNNKVLKLLKTNNIVAEYDTQIDSYAFTDSTGDNLEFNELPDEIQNAIYDNYPAGSTTKHDIYQLPGGKNYKELLITAPKIPGEFVTPAHYDEKNILAHVRFNERTDADGNKVLFLEEVQSDWHQAGRKKGYAGDLTRAQRKKELIRQLRSGEITRQEHNQGRAALIAMDETNNVPNAPFKKAWPMLAMKRMVKYAAENGFDKIAWTTGEQQAARYPESAEADEARLKGMQGFYDKMLPSMLNKEFNRGKWGKARVEVIETDLGKSTYTIFTAGEPTGLQESYESVQRTLETLRKEWPERTFEIKKESDKTSKQLSLPITDRMKSKALREGMPMFQFADMPISEQVLGGLINKKTATNTKAFKSWFGDSVTKTKNGDPVIFYHGTDEVFEEFTKDDQSKSGHLTADLGHFFTMQKGLAEKYGQHQIKAYLKMEKPYRMSLEESQSFDYFGEAEQFKADLQKQGYDSIIIATGASPYVIIFESGQAKSIHNQGDWNDDKNIYFEVREAPEQKIPQATYDALHAEKNDRVKSFAQQARIKFTEVKLLTDKLFGSISTRLGNIDPELSEHVRTLGFDETQKIIEVLKVAQPILDATHGKKNKLGIRQGGMTAADKDDWNVARLQADKGKIEQLAQKYNLTEHLINLREKLDQIRAEAILLGYDVGFIDEYWPRAIKDREGFLQATEGISQEPVFTQAFREQAKKLGITQKQFEREFPEVKADIISNLILGQSSGISGPGNIQSRVFDTIPDEYVKFYMDADASLMQYVYSMTKKIEARKFFGKVPAKISRLKAQKKQKQADLIKFEQLADMARIDNPKALVEYEAKITDLNEAIVLIEEPLNLYKVKNDYKENIGTYVTDMITSNRIKKKDEKTVNDILNARFKEHGTTGIVNTLKNFSYIDTMGSPTSAITQIGDLAWAMYVGKVWTPKGFVGTGKNLVKAMSGKSDISKEDLGFERIAQEFADNTTLGKAVSQVFKMVGLEKMDSIGKEVLINNALDQYKAQAAKDPEALAKQIKPIFRNKATDVVQELLAYDPTNANSNPSDNIKRLLYSKVLDFHPAALSQMTEGYLIGGDLRVFYMLKTYTIQQMDVFRREVFNNIKSKDPQRKIQGIQNMFKLTVLLTLANAGADEIKNFMLGKETRFSDNVIENFLTIGGASRYTKMQISREGFGSAFLQQALPPMKFINSASKDMQEGYKNYVSGDTSNFDHARIIDSIPGVGKLYYWHYGRGGETKKSLAENDFKKDSKATRLFKKQLENSTDKRLFIQANLDRFKKMKLQENFQTGLNKNKADINQLEKILKLSLKRNGAVINKLESKTSTENIQTRLGQLKAQREQILKRYFEVAEGMN